MLQSAMQVKDELQPCDKLYDVIKTHEGYEERHYPSAVCACTVVTNVYQDAAKTEAFRSLQNYARGQNEEGVYLSLKPPILTQVVCDSNVSFERKFVICSYLSSDVTDMFPKPSSPDVFIKTLPSMTVFVKSFKGITSDERWTQETRNFTETINQRENIRTDFYITATYDSPFHLVSNRNEVWLVKYSNQSHKALASLDGDTEFVQIGSSKVEVPSIVSWFLYALVSYFSVLLFMINTVMNTGVYARDNWATIKRNAGASLKQLKGVLTLDNFNVMSKIGIGATKLVTNVSFSLVSSVLQSVGFSAKKET